MLASRRKICQCRKYHETVFPEITNPRLEAIVAQASAVSLQERALTGAKRIPNLGSDVLVTLNSHHWSELRILMG